MADVFISYHEKSAGELAAQIARTLEAGGISCWYAKRDIPTGADFARTIPPQIDACKVFLLILNENAQTSKHIENELGLAFSRSNRGEEITIFPVEIGDFEKEAWIKYYLIHAQSIKTPVLGSERLQELLQRVIKLLNRAPQTPMLPVNIIKSGKCGNKGDNVTYALDENGVLRISGYGDMQHFYKNAWWDKSTMIDHVEIQNGVTSIGSSAFTGCVWLKNIIIPDSVTSIGNSAFDGCAELTSITIPGSVTSIGDSAFFFCTGLTSVIIPDSVVSIGDRAFCGCVRLKSITIPDSVTFIGDAAFASCAGLKNIIIPDGVRSIENYAFSRCKELKSVIIPDSVVSIGTSAFDGCAELKSIIIPSSVTFIGNHAFDGCMGLKSVTIPESVTSIGNWAFCNCTGLKSVTIPDSVTSIGFEAFFANCTALTNVSIPAKTEIHLRAFPDSVTVTRRT